MRKIKDSSGAGMWIGGVNPVREALRSRAAHPLEFVYCRGDSRLRELVELSEARNIPARQESREILAALLGHVHHQGVALRVSEYPYADLDQVLELDLRKREPLIILDSMMRSACFLGARGLIIPKDRSARVTATVIKVSAGAASHLPVMQVTNLVRSLERLKESGLWVVGLEAEGSVSIQEVDLTVPLGLVIGNEQKGLRPLVRSHCDILVRIPSHGPVDSLNAAVAGAVALAEVQRQRISAHRGLA
jgi:23S rRNA (guanosine2251-2'-O)-methyltransferase